MKYDNTEVVVATYNALQYAMESQNTYEYLITQNTKNFKKLDTLKVVTPEAFLDVMHI